MTNSYVIIKNYKTPAGTTVPVIMLDSQGEVLEFSSETEAETMRQMFQKNSDSGYKFSLREIKGHFPPSTLNS
jgi:hypothetical protein